MLNTNDNYTAINLEFNYLNLKKYLFKLYKQGLDNFNIALLISLEKEYYEGKNLKRIIKDFSRGAGFGDPTPQRILLQYQI